MYEISPYVYAVLTGWCTAAAALLIEHVICAPRAIPYWPRYVMGVTALLAGGWVVEQVSGRSTGVAVLAIIATSGGLIFALYELRVLHSRELRDAEEKGRIEGRIYEANRRAGAARIPDDRRN